MVHVPNAVDLERLKRLAAYIAHGISEREAGVAVGFSESRVSQLLQDEDFQSILAEKQQEILAQYIDVNDKYDALEKSALTNLVENLKFNRDPDFNLRVAMLANRAVRRGKMTHTQQPLSATDAGQRLVLNFSPNFIVSAQQGDLARAHANQADLVDHAPASQATVETLLRPVHVETTNKRVGFQNVLLPIDA